MIEFAVKALIFNDDGFLAVHKRGIKSDKLELPDGRMIFGETAEKTVIREVLEETGLKITPISLVDTWNYITKTHQVTGVIYLCKAENLAELTLSDEHNYYEWLATDNESLAKMNQLFRPQMLTWDWNSLINKAAIKHE